MGDRTPTLRARGLTKVYRTGDVEVHALRGLDLVLETSELVVLLGPSGSGKSTLLNILGGLDTATGGEAWFLDHELTGLDDAGLLEGPAGRRHAQVGGAEALLDVVPRLDPAALADPLVGGVHDAGQHGVRDPQGRDLAAGTDDDGAWHALLRIPRGGHSSQDVATAPAGRRVRAVIAPPGRKC